MKTVTAISFRCPSCLKVIAPPYAPPEAPNCPACGVKMEAAAATQSKPRVYCPRCQTVGEAYSSDRCPKCGGPWYGFTSATTPEQDPEAAFRGTGVTPDKGPTANNLGPETR